MSLHRGVPKTDMEEMFGEAEHEHDKAICPACNPIEYTGVAKHKKFATLDPKTGRISY